MQGGECVKCSLIWVKWGRVHRAAGIVCNAERGYTVLEREKGVSLDWIEGWKEKVREKNMREGENAILYEYTTIQPAYYFLYRLILGCRYRLQLFSMRILFNVTTIYYSERMWKVKFFSLIFLSSKFNEQIYLTDRY